MKLQSRCTWCKVDGEVEQSGSNTNSFAFSLTGTSQQVVMLMTLGIPRATNRDLKE